MKKQMLTRITNIVCVVLLVALFASFFLPSWDYTATVKKEGSRETMEVPANASVMEYTWMAFKNKDLTKDFKKLDYEVNDIVWMPFVLTLCTVLTLVFCLLNNKGSWQSVFPLIGSGWAVIALLTTGLFQMGPYWSVNLVLACVALVPSLVLFGIFAKTVFDWFTVKHQRL